MLPIFLSLLSFSNYTAPNPEFKDWRNGPEMQIAYKQVDELITTACNIVTDREVAAMIQYDLCNFREVATKYYDTQMAKVVWGKCDNLIDYHAEKLH